MHGTEPRPRSARSVATGSRRCGGSYMTVMWPPAWESCDSLWAGPSGPRTLDALTCTRTIFVQRSILLCVYKIQSLVACIARECFYPQVFWACGESRHARKCKNCSQFFTKTLDSLGSMGSEILQSVKKNCNELLLMLWIFFSRKKKSKFDPVADGNFPSGSNFHCSPKNEAPSKKVHFRLPRHFHFPSSW